MPRFGGLQWTYTLLKQLLVYSVLFLMVLLFITYYFMNGNWHLKTILPLKGNSMNNIMTENEPSEHLNILEILKRTSVTEFNRRRGLVEDVCTSANTLSGSVHGVFTHNQSGVIYCFVPKSGCTFWKRVFNFVNNEIRILNGSYKSPFEIPRLAVHTLNTANGYRFNKEQHGPQNYPIRLIVTRDPMSRMIASYLDKMYLPDFWENFGVQFMMLANGLRVSRGYIKRQFENSNIFTNQSRLRIKGHYTPMVNLMKQKGIPNKISEKPENDFLRKHFDELAAMLNHSFDPKESSTSDLISCGKYLTFSEFITGTLYYPEPHWTPAYQLCNPCQFLPTHIGRMETFTADARVILSEMGLYDVLENFDSVAQVDEELRSITDYYFTLAFRSSRKSFYSACLTTRELAVRLWNNFQWHGYIHSLLKYTIPAISAVDEVQVDFMTQIWKAREMSLKHPEALKKIKTDFAQKLVSTVPTSVLEELTWKFRLDSDMFGYKRINRSVSDSRQ